VQVLGHRITATTPKTVFSLGGYCINDLRTTLLPARAEGYILSASAVKMKEGMKDLTVPKLPEEGIISPDEAVEYLNKIELISLNRLIKIVFLV